MINRKVYNREQILATMEYAERIHVNINFREFVLETYRVMIDDILWEFTVPIDEDGTVPENINSFDMIEVDV